MLTHRSCWPRAEKIWPSVATLLSHSKHSHCRDHSHNHVPTWARKIHGPISTGMTGTSNGHAVPREWRTGESNSNAIPAGCSYRSVALCN